MFPLWLLDNRLLYDQIILSFPNEVDPASNVSNV